MPSIAESLANQSQLEAALRAGIEAIDRGQQVTFDEYVKVVLPFDGYVYWVKTGSVTVSGSLHYATDRKQNDDETFDLNSVIFTSEAEIAEFNRICPTTMFIATFGPIQFAFSQRNSFYKQAEVYHYRGEAVFPVMQSLIDNVNAFDTENVVVSNSLPIWISMIGSAPVIPYTQTQQFPLFPSYLVPDNLPPPYGVVHIPPESTRAIQAFPSLDAMSNHLQLVRDTVKITLYGTRNFNALDFQDYVINYSMVTDNFGIMNMPVMRDEKRTQKEMAVIAMKKTIEFEISYYQQRANDLARQLILSALLAVKFSPNPVN